MYFKQQIKRRLLYQYNKTRDDAASSEHGASDSLNVLKAKLTGIAIKKPRMKTAYNIWGPENRALVDPIFTQRVQANNVPAKNQAALRSAIYKEFFNQLSADERQQWVQRAEVEHKLVLDEIDKKMKAGPSTSPEDRQK